MRFKKLRVFVGLSLIIFILIVGNIIIFNHVLNDDDSNKSDSDKSTYKTLIVIDPKTLIPQNQIIQGETNGNSKNKVNTKTTTKKTRKPMVRHKRKTRAS